MHTPHAAQGEERGAAQHGERTPSEFPPARGLQKRGKAGGGNTHRRACLSVSFVAAGLPPAPARLGFIFTTGSSASQQEDEPSVVRKFWVLRVC